MGKVIRCTSLFIQAKERVSKAAFTLPPKAKESLLQDIVTSTTLKDRDTSEELLELFCTIPEETAPSSRSTSETPTNTKNRPNTS